MTENRVPDRRGPPIARRRRPAARRAHGGAHPHGWMKPLFKDLSTNPYTQYKVHMWGAIYWLINFPLICCLFFFTPTLWLKLGIFITLIYSIYANLATTTAPFRRPRQRSGSRSRRRSHLSRRRRYEAAQASGRYRSPVPDAWPGPTTGLPRPSSQAPNPCEWLPGLGWRSHREATPAGRPRRGGRELDNGWRGKRSCAVSACVSCDRS